MATSIVTFSNRSSETISKSGIALEYYWNKSRVDSKSSSQPILFDGSRTKKLTEADRCWNVVEGVDSRLRLWSNRFKDVFKWFKWSLTMIFEKPEIKFNLVSVERIIIFNHKVQWLLYISIWLRLDTVTMKCQDIYFKYHKLSWLLWIVWSLCYICCIL